MSQFAGPGPHGVEGEVDGSILLERFKVELDNSSRTLERKQATNLREGCYHAIVLQMLSTSCAAWVAACYRIVLCICFSCLVLSCGLVSHFGLVLSRFIFPLFLFVYLFLDDEDERCVLIYMGATVGHRGPYSSSLCSSCVGADAWVIGSICIS